MAAASVFARTQEKLTLSERLDRALENYRSWAGGLGLVHNNFGSDWATELQHAEERVLRVFREFLANDPEPAKRQIAEEALAAEGLSLPAK